MAAVNGDNGIVVEQLVREYRKGPRAVDGIDLQVRPGEIYGFLGPNGAGKSTTVHVLTTLLPPTSGTASIAGFDIVDQSLEARGRVGYLPENVPLYEDMTVQSYLVFFAKLRGVQRAKIRDRVNYVMEATRITGEADTIIGKLSKGFRQRVGIAQAMVHNPDVLILDEPTAGLDPKQILDTRGLIRSLAGEHTIILSTHILPEVEQTCEKVIIINKGKLVATDTVSNLTNRLRGSEAVAVEVAGRNGVLEKGQVQQRLEQLAGVSRVIQKDSRDNRLLFEVESLQGRSVRADLARSVIESGWDLLELRPVGLSLEDIFLQLTATDNVVAAGGQQ